MVTELDNTIHFENVMDRGAAEMKTHYRKFVVLALLTLALSAAGLAQDFAPGVRADIPFSFYAGGKILPPGLYTLAVNMENNNVAIFQSQGAGTFLLGSRADGSNNGRYLLVFHANAEGTYVLQRVEEPNFGVGFVSEKAASHVAASQPADTTRIVIASLTK